ncbi:MAG: metallophosphoesterase [Acetobacteraceae bacterium]|nr:metallophosphoesterase [Acetobacteraceae bacterium]
MTAADPDPAMPPPVHLLHLTDLHLPPPGETVHGADTASRLDAVLDDILARHGPGGEMPRPEFAVVTGDLTRDGEPAAYRRLRAALARLPCPAHLLMGNHDKRAAFRATFPEARMDADGFVQQAVHAAAGLCLMLDTLEEGRPEGRLCARRLAWLAARLAESGGAPVLLFMHHPPMPVGMAAMDQAGLMDAAALWAVLAPHRGRIRHLFHGHLHRPIAGAWHGIPVFSLRGSAFDVALDLAPPPRQVSVEASKTPCYAVIRVTEDSIVAHTRALLPTPC